jgi:hypothetical protein
MEHVSLTEIGFDIKGCPKSNLENRQQSFSQLWTYSFVPRYI